MSSLAGSTSRDVSSVGLDHEHGQIHRAELTIVVYTVLYGSFSAYPYIFSAHGLSVSTVGLTFLPVLVGFFLLLIGTFAHYVRYKRLTADAKQGIQRRGIHNGKVEPEERLVPRKSH